jgi:RNA polymerase sigma-70 factor (ECF subfamily)
MQNRIVHDEELLVRLQRGDEWVYQLLVRRFREKVFSTAFGLTYDMEESLKIFKDVFQEIYDGAASTEGDITLNELIHRITIQRCLHRKKKWLRPFKGKKSSVDPSEYRLPEVEGNASVDASLRPKGKWIKNTIRSLSASAQTVYVLREVQKLSYEEIANVMGIRPAVARTKMLRTRQKIYQLLQTGKDE